MPPRYERCVVCILRELQRAFPGPGILFRQSSFYRDPLKKLLFLPESLNVYSLKLLETVYPTWSGLINPDDLDSIIGLIKEAESSHNIWKQLHLLEAFLLLYRYYKNRLTNSNDPEYNLVFCKDVAAAEWRLLPQDIPKPSLTAFVQERAIIWEPQLLTDEFAGDLVAVFGIGALYVLPPYQELDTISTGSIATYTGFLFKERLAHYRYTHLIAGFFYDMKAVSHLCIPLYHSEV